MSMSENKCCGNCKHFKNEDVEGWGWCSLNKTKTHCAQSWDCHNDTFNGWTEITPDNIDKIRKSQKKIVIMNPKEWDVPEMLYSIKADSLVLYSEWGGYYYYVLPELKIE